MKYFLSCVAAFTVAITVTNFFFPFYPPAKASGPVAQFEGCLDKKDPEARAKCVNEKLDWQFAAGKPDLKLFTFE